MSTSRSSSSNRSDSTTITQDNRIVGGEGQTVSSAGGDIAFNTNFDKNISAAFDSILKFAGDVTSGAGKAIEQTIKSNENILAQATGNVDNLLAREQLGSASLFRDVIPILVLGGAVVAGFTLLKGK